MDKYFEKRKQAWDDLKKRHPNIDKVLRRMQNKIQKSDDIVGDVFDFLEKNYPIEGFEWSIEPNDRLICLDCKEQWDEIDKRSSERLNKQIKCVEKFHHFQEINGMKWCSYCGMLVDDDKKYIPESPHFLGSQKEE